VRCIINHASDGTCRCTKYTGDNNLGTTANALPIPLPLCEVVIEILELHDEKLDLSHRLVKLAVDCWQGHFGLSARGVERAQNVVSGNPAVSRAMAI